MNCEKIQELILTDYLDGEMDEEQKKVILQHLANCVDCQNFMVTAKKTVNELFSNVESINPDEFLWYKIKGVIEAEKQRQNKPNRGIVAMIRDMERILIPAFVMTVVVMVVIWMFTIKQFSFYKTETQLSPPEVYLGLNYYMEDKNVEDALMENVNFQTAIEEYFL
jgi:predicted anti-sigma-YlaC factor YlaD